MPVQMKLLPTAKTEQLGDSVNNKQLSTLNSYLFSYHLRLQSKLAITILILYSFPNDILRYRNIRDHVQ
jgi:hypothetical protein